MLVSGIFKQLRTFVDVPFFLSTFSKIGECFVLQMKCVISASVKIVFYWARLVIWFGKMWQNWKTRPVNYFALRHHKSIEENTCENTESLKQYMGVSYIFPSSYEVWLLAPPLALIFQPSLISVEIWKEKSFSTPVWIKEIKVGWKIMYQHRLDRQNS